MSLTKKILDNFLILFSSQTIIRLSNFLIVIYLVRVITPSEFGLLNFAKTMALYFGLILNIGLDQFGLRELSKDRTDKNNLINTIISIKCLLAIGAYAALALFILFFRLEYDIKKMALLYGLTIIAESLSLVWVFNAFEKMKNIFYAETISIGSLLILVIVFVKGSPDILKVPIFEAASVLAGSLLLISNFYLMGRKLSFSINFKAAKDLIIQVLPLGLASAIGYIYYSFGVTFLGFIKGMRDVGIYMAPYKLVLVLTQAILGILSMVIIPTIAKLFIESKDNLKTFLSELSRMLMFLSLLIFILGMLLAEPIIEIIYGNSYLESVGIFRILIWWLVTVYMSFHLTLTLYACDKTKYFFKASFYALLINVILNIFLTPALGMAGPAIAMVLSGGASFFIALSYVNKNVVRLPLGKRELVFLAGSISTAMILGHIRFSLPYKIILAIGLYVILSLLTRILRRKDFAYVKELISAQFKI